MTKEINTYEQQLIPENLERSTCSEVLYKRWRIILWSILLAFSFLSIGITSSFNFKKMIASFKQIPTSYSHQSNYSKSSCMTQSNNEFGYPPSLIENLVRDKEISLVFPVYAGHRDLLVNLLRSMRNLCMDCSEVPIIVITDDDSKKAIYDSLFNNTWQYPNEVTIAKSFSKLSIKLLRDVMPYYTVNQWNDQSLLVNGKFLIQSHKKMFGVLNGASTRFSWAMDVDSFFFKPMSLAKVLKTYLSSPYIITTHDWSGGQDIYDCSQNLTRSFLSTGYTVEVMHWIYDRQIVLDYHNVVLSQYPNWNASILFQTRYFFELAYYHFIMSNQIQHRKYMEYRILEVRTLLGGNRSPLLQSVVKTASGGLIERIGNSITRFPNIYPDIVRIWKQFQIPVFRPEGSELVAMDVAFDTDVVIMTNAYRDALYKMALSEYWKNPDIALKNAEKQGWKPLADHIIKRNNKSANLK